MIQLNGEEPAGHEKKGRALILLEQERGRPRRAAQGRAARSDERAYHMLARHRAQQARQGRRGRARVPRRDQGSARRRRGARAARHGAARPAASSTRRRRYLDKAIELDPRNGRAYFELGLLSNAQKNRRKPSSRAREGGEAVAERVAVLVRVRRDVSRSQERFDEAISAYKKAVELDPPYPKALQKLGLLLVERKQYDEAEVVLTQAIRRDQERADQLPPPRAWRTPGGRRRATRWPRTRSISSSHRRTIRSARRSRATRSRTSSDAELPDRYLSGATQAVRGRSMFRTLVVRVAVMAVAGCGFTGTRPAVPDAPPGEPSPEAVTLTVSAACRSPGRPPTSTTRPGRSSRPR